MNPIAIVQLVNALFSMTEELLPQLSKMSKDGQITPEQQAKLIARYNSLKTRADGQFSGPEWKIEAPAAVPAVTG